LKYPFTLNEWQRFPIQKKLLDEIRERRYQIYDDVAVDPEKVKSLKILNAYKRGTLIKVYYQVWYNLMADPFESTGRLVYIN
jgi:hypothetical protein